MKKSLFFGMAALLAAGFASCSNDDLLPDRDKPVEGDQSFYVNIDISTVEALTRADKNGPYGEGEDAYDPTKEPNFDTGKDKENTVQTIYLVFYDKEKKRVSTTQVRRGSGTEAEGRNPSENKLYQGVVQIDVKHGSLEPRYVMCFINPISSQNFDINPEFADLDDLQEVTRPRIIDDEDHFAMSKSVYFGPDRSDENYTSDWDTDLSKYQKIVATPIPSGQLYKTVGEAQQALTDGNLIDIYVERYAAKVSLTADMDESARTTTIDEHTLVFVPEYWAVNAYEDETYICKSFKTEDGSRHLTYQEMNGALGGANAFYWNSPSHHRSYWAQSPAYYAAEYPRVADDILDYKQSHNGRDGFALGYYSYDEMKANANGRLNAKARNLLTSDKAESIYARENTVSGSALRDAYTDPMASPKAAVASAVVVGHYEIDGVDYSKAVNGIVPNFYVRGNETNGYSLYKSDEEMLKYFVNTSIQFAVGSSESNLSPIYNYSITNTNDFTDPKYANLFKIAHPTIDVRGNLDLENGLVVDSRFVTVQLNVAGVAELEAEGLGLYALINGVYTKVNISGADNNLTEVNKQLFYSAGTAQGYQGGKAFFSIPIKHLGFYRTNNPNAGAMGTEKDFKWNQVLSGDFGLVRNHSYSISISEIKGLGNGIPDPDVPIVPPTDPEEYFIGARIIVLNWAIVPQQNVKL